MELRGCNIPRIEEDGNVASAVEGRSETKQLIMQISGGTSGSARQA